MAPAPMPRARAPRVEHHVQFWSASVLLVAAMGLVVIPRPALAQARPPVPVTISAAVAADVPIYQSGIGTVQAFNTVKIQSQVDGQLQKIAFVEGQKVKAGDLLAVIDPSLFQAALDQAIGKTQQDQASLANAETMLNRDQQLGARDFASQQSVDTQYSTVQQLKAQILQDNAAVSRARSQLAYTQINSPIDGRTGFRLVDVGNIVHPSDASGIVVVTQTQPISVISTLAEDALPAVRAAQKAGPVPVIALDKAGQKLADGTLALVDNEISAQSGTIQLKSTFANADEALWPGQYVQIQVLTDTIRTALTVPSTALQRGPDGMFVYVIDAGEVAASRPVRAGQISGGTAVIEAGLAAGERIVTSGQYRLAPGLKVQATSAAAGGGGASRPPAE